MCMTAIHRKEMSMEHRCPKTVAVVGGGAAGMMAAICAARKGAKVLLLEKNSRPGRKIGITGKGRCNVTNADELSDFFKNIVSNPRFLYSVLYGFTNRMLMECLEEAGVPLKIERGNRVFPVSDSARDIVDAMTGMLKREKVRMVTGVTVLGLQPEEGHWKILTPFQEYTADCVIVATGGQSYSKTGSTGDGYEMARELGHHIQSIRPGLIALNASDRFVPGLRGLSLKNVEVRITQEDGKEVYQGFGEMLFTHFGVSGPLILSASSLLQKYLLEKKKSWKEAGFLLHIDLKPALGQDKLDDRVLRDLERYRGRHMENALQDLLPERLIAAVLEQSGIDAMQRAGDLTRQQRMKLVETLKDLRYHLTGTRPIEEAIVTMGGVDTRELDPRTMQSRLHPGLYFAGEVVDVDALTGGYNLQIAFSTGAAAGSAAAE